MKQLSKDEMKMVIGGRFTAFTCVCVGSGGYEWYWPTENQPSQATVDAAISNNCSSNSATCTWKVYPGEIPPLP